MNTAETTASFGRRLTALPARALLGAIALYQRTLGPALPVVTLGGCACRFTPTCSHYAAEAIRSHGALRGTWLALRRLLKCTPLHPGGFDPVPPKTSREGGTNGQRDYRCTRLSRHSPASPSFL